MTEAQTKFLLSLVFLVVLFSVWWGHHQFENRAPASVSTSGLAPELE